MALARNFKASTSNPNQIALNWLQPLGFNLTNDELIVTKTTNHFPVELHNDTCDDVCSDSRPIEIFRGNTIVGTTIANISVSGNTLTDTGASFPTTPPLNGRLLRDSVSSVFKIISNTATTITVDGTPANGKYVILADFPTTTRSQQNFELDIRTVVGPGFISNLVEIRDGALQLVTFEPEELVNLIFRDGSGNKFIVKSNTEDTILFFETSTPSIGVGMSLFDSHFETAPQPYIDNFRTEDEADNRKGTKLLDNQFYYYTVFTKLIGGNVGRAEYGIKDSGLSTQDVAISMTDRGFGDILYNYWPSLYRELDETGDLEDLMAVFAFQFSELHALIDTYNLQDTDRIYVNALVPLSEQFGLPSIGFSIGIDTLRRIANDLISAYKLKGSKEGIALFIKILTTWDITNGTADFSGAILDFLPNIEALRFFDPNLGNTNTRITQTDPFVAGGRFAKTLPGIVIPGFFTFREFVVELPKVAMYLGDSESFTISNGTTTMIDTANNFGATDTLVGNFLIPNEEEVNDIFQIIANTSTSITVRGVINNRVPGGDYAVLSALNTNRFIILNKMMDLYIPFGTKAGFTFTLPCC